MVSVPFSRVTRHRFAAAAVAVSLRLSPTLLHLCRSWPWRFSRKVAQVLDTLATIPGPVPGGRAESRFFGVGALPARGFVASVARPRHDLRPSTLAKRPKSRDTA